mmetsp:Transcript_7049/g.18103  ORF Transcript_7049/g.18103 Transcript_7049/m.18103 type:complete len:204 (+) Transcript_7049:8464-9075(+)
MEAPDVDARNALEMQEANESFSATEDRSERMNETTPDCMEITNQEPEEREEKKGKKEREERKNYSAYPIEDQWINASNMHWVFYGCVVVIGLIIYLLYCFFIWVFRYFEKNLSNEEEGDVAAFVGRVLFLFFVWVGGLIFLIYFIINVSFFWEDHVWTSKDPRGSHHVDFIYFWTHPIRYVYLQYAATKTDTVTEKGQVKELS